MVLTPDSTINLYRGVGINSDEQLVFKSINNQAAYFNSKLVISSVPCTVVKKTGKLRLDVPGATVKGCNYLSFINPSFDNKVIYCAIVDYDYINNECVEIDYVIDFWQTWMFDVNFADMYIDREHLSQTDWSKAELNPYDPSILEFKTVESLPISEDIEKPYYSYGTSSNDDGIYCVKATADAFNIGDYLGALVVFSDVNLSSADNGTPGADKPSGELTKLLYSTVYNNVTMSGTTMTRGSKKNNTSFFRISYAIQNYINNAYSGPTSYMHYGDVWTNNNVGSLVPAGTSRLITPVSYVYIDGTDTNARQYLSELLAWFTNNLALDSILGIYPISNSMILYSGQTTSQSPSDPGVIYAQLDTASGQNVVNKKLDLYPFSYYRLITPNGDIKELKIENFKDAQDGLSKCKVGLSLDIVERPVLLAAPINYKASGASPNSSATNMNVREGIVFSQFPTLPYAIDAFAMQLASVANNTIANNTLENQYDLAKEGGSLGNLIGGLFAVSTYGEGGMGGQTVDVNENLVNRGTSFGAGAAQAGMNATSLFGAARSANYMKTQNLVNMKEDASKILVGSTDNAIYDNLKYTKPAYACNQYHQINGDGTINFNIFSFEDVIFMRVGINPAILAQMDTYFSNFGYTSGRCGIPRVVNYSRGSNDPDALPHWQSLNGKDTTYIKTKNCKVEYVMSPVADFIKNMFDAGIRFIKGDLS